MQQFKNTKTREVFETRFTKNIPEHISIHAHEIMRILVAARSLQDVGVLGPIVRWRNAPDRFSLLVNGKWHVTFAWSEEFGASEIILERR